MQIHKRIFLSLLKCTWKINLLLPFPKALSEEEIISLMDCFKNFTKLINVRVINFS